MLLLDTNVVSELMRPRPEPRVLGWVADQPAAAMAVSTVTVMEIRLGIALLPAGHRRGELDTRFARLLAEGFPGRVLAFDEAAADACAEIRAVRRRIGSPITTEDAMIAAIGRARGAAVVTRDARGFAGCGVRVVDPWQS